jgi:hypothetical protein
MFISSSMQLSRQKDDYMTKKSKFHFQPCTLTEKKMCRHITVWVTLVNAYFTTTLQNYIMHGKNASESPLLYVLINAPHLCKCDPGLCSPSDLNN